MLYVQNQGLTCLGKNLWYLADVSTLINKAWHAGTNGFSIAFQIRWKFRFTLISSLIKWSLQNFEHGTTAVLSWHVQNFVAIWWPATELQQDEVSIEFALRAKNR